MLNINEYFDGNVKSISFQSTDLPATVGVMAIGAYTFGTSQKEYMSVISGQLEVKLPSESNWKTFNDGESFTVEANKEFEVRATIETAYLCKYE